MARYNPNGNREAVFEAARAWKQRCLIHDASLLSNAQLWTKDHLDSLANVLVKHPPEQDGSFLDKLKQQLGGAPAAAKLMAEMLWMLLLFPSRLTPRKKREMITEVYRLSDDEPPGDSPFLTDMVLVGLGYPGAAFSIHRLKELNYLITLAQKFKALSPGAREQVLRNFL